MAKEGCKLFFPGQNLLAEDLNGNFFSLEDSLEKIENLLIKIYKKETVQSSDLIFESSQDIFFDKNKGKKLGRYGILKDISSSKSVPKK